MRTDGSLFGWGDARRLSNAAGLPKEIRRFVARGRIEPGALLLAGSWVGGGQSYTLDSVDQVARLLGEAGSVVAGKHQLIALFRSGRGPGLASVEPASQPAQPAETAPAPSLMPEPEPPAAGPSEGTDWKPGALLVVGDFFRGQQDDFDARFKADVDAPFR